MKKLLIFVLLLPLGMIAQEIEDNTVYSLQDVDVKPEFPGGVDAVYKVIGQNFKTPVVSGLNGRIITQFIIEKDGSVGHFENKLELGHGTANEAIRSIKLAMRSPWKPAVKNGKVVRCYYLLPIMIRN